MFTRLDYSSALEYSIIRRYTNIVYYYYDYYYEHCILKSKLDGYSKSPLSKHCMTKNM